MSFDVKIEGVNVSDDVKSCDAVPVIDRNRDWTLIASEINLQVFDNVDVDKGDTVTVANEGSSYPFFKGIVMEKRWIKNNREKYFNLRVAHFLTKLKDIVLDYDTVHPAIIAGAGADQYIASDNFGFPNVQVLWFIQKMFELAEINIDFSRIENQPIETINVAGTNRDIVVSHLVLDENMLYCIDHDTAALHTIIDVEDYASQKWNMWDFFSQFVSWIGEWVVSPVIGFNVRWTQVETDTPETIDFLVRDDDLITFSDDDKFEDNPDQASGEPGGYNYNPRYANNRGVYNTASASALVDHKFGLGKNIIDHPDNLVFLYRKFWGSAGDVIDFPANTYSPAALLQNKIRTKVGNFNIYNYKVPYPYSVSVPDKVKQLLVETNKKDVSTFVTQEVEII